MSENEADPNEDNPRKRVRQACLNCRKKKVRCSGEKPVCNLCSRLAQSCRYVEPPDPSAYGQPHSPTATGLGGSYAADEINAKLQTLQDRLASIEHAIQGILPVLSSLAQQTHSSSQTEALAPAAIVNNDPPDRNPIHEPQLGLAITTVRPSPSLPPIHTLQLAADIYFRFCYNQPYSLFHEATFRQRLASGDLPEYLLWALYGAACRYSRLIQQGTASHEDGLSYIKIAWDRMQIPWNPSPNDKEILPVLQTLILLVSNEHPAGHCSTAYIKLGFALRLALRARYHLEPNTDLSPIAKEERRRVFWALYIQDKLISLSRENIPVLRDDQCRVRLPSSEQAFREGVEELTPELEEVKNVVDESVITRCNPLALNVVLASSLSLVTQYILLENRAAKPIPPWSPTSPYAAAVLNLMQLESHFGLNEPLEDHLQHSGMTNGSIDQQIAGPLIYSRALFHLCHCLLHHPFLLKELIHRSRQKAPPSFLSRAWETCRFHAAGLSDLNVLRSQDLVLLTSLYGYSTMIAGTIHVLSMHDQNLAVREAAQGHFDKSVEFLTELSHFWKHAGLMLDRLKRFHQRSIQHSHLLDPKQIQNGRSPDELETLWHTVDYGLLSAPTRPGTPSTDEVSQAPGSAPTVPVVQDSFFDFDFAAWSEAPDMSWNNQPLNGSVGFFDTHI